MRTYDARVLLGMLAVFLMPEAAHAHGVMAGVTDFFAGFLHPVTAVEHILPIVALGVLAGQNGLQRCQAALVAFPVAIAAGAAVSLRIPGVPYIELLNIVSGIVIGGLIALAFSLPVSAVVVLASLFGLTHGYANGTAIEGSMKAFPFIAGVVLSAFLAIAYGLGAADFLLRRKAGWLPVAIRVAGSWTAAIGLLVLSVMHKTLFAG